jgi:hypothetical protein
LRVLSGRLKAVLVATLATIILIGVIGPSITMASDPPGLARFMAAIAHVESGGDYYARNPVSGAYGKYQIMPSSWRAWADRYLGDPNAKPTPANQEFVAAAKFRSLYSSLGAWRRVAYWWLTGSSRTTGWSTYATHYVSRVMTYYNDGPAIEAVTASVSHLHRFSDHSSAIVYAGTWKFAGYPGYAGGEAKYATAAGASATFTFSGTRVTWFGPVGPTRGQARVSIDGGPALTVNLYRSAFIAHKALFSKGWATSAKHSMVITVVGTAGHPYVAIDELVVAN